MRIAPEAVGAARRREEQPPCEGVGGGAQHARREADDGPFPKIVGDDGKVRDNEQLAYTSLQVRVSAIACASAFAIAFELDSQVAAVAKVDTSSSVHVYVF